MSGPELSGAELSGRAPDARPVPGGAALRRPPVLICPDLHDSAARLCVVKERLKAWREREPETQLILLGDTFDRGKAARETLAFVHAEVERGGTLLTGNHEAMAYCGTFLGGREAVILHSIWSRVGGQQWREAIGPNWRDELRWIGRHARLAVTLRLSDSDVLLVHADVPNAAEWSMLTALGAQAPHGEARLEQLSAEDAMEGPQGRTGFLWSHPGPGGWPGTRVARGHDAALHGHVPRNQHVMLPPHAGHPGGLALDLLNPSRLTTVHVSASEEWTIES